MSSAISVCHCALSSTSVRKCLFTRSEAIVIVLLLCAGHVMLGGQKQGTDYFPLHRRLQGASSRHAHGTFPHSRSQHCSVPVSSQCVHLDDKAIPHIAVERPLIRLIDLLDRDHLDIGGDMAFRAVIEHLLRLAYTTDARARQCSSFEDEREGLDLQRLGRNP